MINSLSVTAAWTQVQVALSKMSASTIVLGTLCLGLLVVLVDYAYMIYLHFRMVSISQSKDKDTAS